MDNKEKPRTLAEALDKGWSPPLLPKTPHEQERIPEVVGICWHCGNNVMERVKKRLSHPLSELAIGGPPPQWIYFIDDYYCIKCKVLYAEPPPPKE